jgi:hypothetical protein
VPAHNDSHRIHPPLVASLPPGGALFNFLCWVFLRWIFLRWIGGCLWLEWVKLTSILGGAAFEEFDYSARRSRYEALSAVRARSIRDFAAATVI